MRDENKCSHQIGIGVDDIEDADQTSCDHKEYFSKKGFHGDELACADEVIFSR